MASVISGATRTVDSENSVFGVETMFLDAETARTTPWADLATVVDEAPTSAEAIELAGLDWTVGQSPVTYEACGRTVVTDQLVNFREDTGAFLGTVTKNYRPVDNAEAFAFTDLLVKDGDARYSSAGSLRGGKVTFVNLDLGRVNVLGDDHDRFVVVANDHTGKHAVRVVETMVRVTCANTLSLALKNAKRVISIPHVGNVEENMVAARYALLGMNRYSEEFTREMERLAKVKVSRDDVDRLAERLFPLDEKAGQQRVNSVEYMRGLFAAALDAEDLANLRGTGAWVVNAASDVAYHRKPLRVNAKHAEGIMSQLFSGARVLDDAYAFVQDLAA